MATLHDPITIGRYEVIERIGCGGMGTVYRAHDPHIGRAVAIKVLVGNDDDLRVRFRQEVRIAGTLAHPNIVAIHDYGEADGRPFIVMEYIEGETLASVLRHRTPLSTAERIRLMQQLCAALEYAHGRGVIHRDIKPANLMLSREGDLKVVDFGIAKVKDARLTRTGDVVGTLVYVSPEQLCGGHIDERSDIFSVGVVLYEVLSTHCAFRRDTPSQVMHAILHEQPLGLTACCPDVDPALDRIVMKAIHKSPSQRYQSLDQLSEDLSRVVSATATAASAAGLVRTLIIDRSANIQQIENGISTSRQSRPRSQQPVWIVAGASLGLAVISAGAWPVVTSMMRSANDSAVGAHAVVPSTIVPPAPTDAALEQPALPAVVAVQSTQSSRPRAAEQSKETTAAPSNRKPAESSRSSLQAACDGDARACVESQSANRSHTPSRDRVVELRTLQQACDAGAAQACSELGGEYSRGVAVTQDDVKATGLFRRACDADASQSCVNLGRAYRQGRGVIHDDIEAGALFLRACDAGGQEGCLELGTMLIRGIGGPVDEPRAVEMFQRSCELGSTAGCSNLAVAYARGTGVPRDDVRAVSLYQRACDRGGASACANLATMYAVGRGLTKDLARAAVLFQQSCDGGYADGCRTLSEWYEDGVGVQPNRARAAELLRRANQRPNTETSNKP